MGKSYVASQLAKKLNGEIISVDSVKIYKTLEVGSNKSTIKKNALQVDIPVHLVDLFDVTDEFSTAQYARLARTTVDDILSRGKLPILVGGSCLYIDGFLGAQTAPKRDPQLTAKIQSLLETDDSWEVRSVNVLRQIGLLYKFGETSSNRSRGCK